jgi:hypothetical protein
MCISGTFAYSEKAATICFIASTCWTMVWVERSRSSGLPGFEPAHQLAPHALGRKLDRRQGVSDLVCEAPRDLAPGRLALRLQELRDLVEHEHEALRAGVAGQRRAGADELAPARIRAQGELLAPLRLACGEVLLQELVQLREQRLPGRHFRERVPLRAREVDAEDGARGLVRDAHAQVGLQRDDTAREAGEHDRERLRAPLPPPRGCARSPRARGRASSSCR